MVRRNYKVWLTQNSNSFAAFFERVQTANLLTSDVLNNVSDRHSCAVTSFLNIFLNNVSDRHSCAVTSFLKTRSFFCRTNKQISRVYLFLRDKKRRWRYAWNVLLFTPLWTNLYYVKSASRSIDAWCFDVPVFIWHKKIDKLLFSHFFHKLKSFFR